jgi:AcrR family transcriptional regulator
MPRTTGPGTQQTGKALKQEELVAAAIDCFERFGIQRARVEDVANAAGLSGPNFYNYFPSRSALVDAVVVSRVNAIVDRVGPTIWAAPNLRQALTTGVVDAVAACRADEVFMQLLRVTRRNRLGELGLNSSAFGHDMAVRLWQPALDQARARGDLRAGLTDDEKTIGWLGSVILLMILNERVTPAEIQATVDDYVAPAIATP